MSVKKIALKNGVAFALACVAGIANTQEWTPNYSLYGTPGLVEMPSAVSAPDGELAASISGFSLQQRTTLSFQITPRLTGSFRYSHINELTGPGTGDTFDRSFDVQYRLFDETDYTPSIAVGLRDFIGTGLLTSEYVVATKHLNDKVRVTGGLGWGRMGSHNGFSNPFGVLDDRFETRPENDFGQGGVPSYNQFFRGDAAFFGGLEWKISPKLTFVAEYSSDGYTREVGNGSFDHASPFNFGLNYRPSDKFELSAYSLYGSDFGFTLTTVIDPKTRSAVGGLESAPLPVRVRSGAAKAARSWNKDALPDATLTAALTQVFATEGVELNGIEIEDRRIRVRYTNTKYRSEVQAMGRLARMLSQGAPDSVEEFVFEPMQRGVPMSSTVIKRSDLEALENQPGAVEEIFVRAETSDVVRDAGLVPVQPASSRFEWGLLPYGEITLFDSENPAAIELGVEASARYEIRPNIVLAGAVRKEIANNRKGLGEIKPSTLPPVRRNAPFYAVEGDPGIEYLTLSVYGNPAPQVYSRTTVGYLERMHGGISTEVLWKPVNSDFAIGAELNYSMQRDFDMLFGFQDYDVVTGHVSGYWDLKNGFHAQVDVGRYLAGDWGATVTVDREFENGWRVGAYATLTDVPFEDFGEGSFDKGILLTIPTDWATGQPTRRKITTKLSSLTRDGGARLNVEGRLYDVVRDGHFDDYGDSWGRFWR